MYEYYSLLRLRYRLPVLPIAVFLQPPAGGADSSYEEYVFGLRTIRFEYHLLVLPQVARASLPETNPVTHALTPLVAGRPEDPVELTLTALSGIAHTASDPARQALLGSFVGAYVRLNPEQQADLTRRLTDNENQEVRAMLTLWHEQGLEQGLERGIRQSIRRVLERRLGPIPLQVQEALEEITDTETLDDLTGVAATATSYAEFETALQRGA